MVIGFAKLLVRGAIIGTSSVLVGLKLLGSGKSVTNLDFSEEDSARQASNASWIAKFVSNKLTQKLNSVLSGNENVFETQSASKQENNIGNKENFLNNHQVHQNIEDYAERIKQLEKELRKQKDISDSFQNQLILRNDIIESGKNVSKSINKSPIEMYSDILNYLSEYHSNFQLDDHLPRVIVVGDQSAGKTSVLEMLIQARVFPRGSGRMTTKSPIQVTLNDGPEHFAKFKDSNIRYNLKSETDLKNLRNEIFRRMELITDQSKTVSDKTIFLDIQGPGLKKMILVDLPGLINTVTTELASSTKKDIEEMVKKHIANPNAIILCIQDGSIDAERSSVTQIVSNADPEGDRTIFVLNKADLAEKYLSSKTVSKILKGELFPMKSQAYFALVSGTYDPNSSIEEILKFEENYFKKSKFYKDLDDKQKKSSNLSSEVSKCFWKVVKSTLKTQIQYFETIQQNLEIEWLNKYNGQLELDRDATFNRIKAKLLDCFNNLYEIPKSKWTSKIKNKIERVVLESFIVDIFIPCCFTSNIDKFKDYNSYNLTHKIDIKLNQSLKDEIPSKCIHECQKIVINEFTSQIQSEISAQKNNYLVNLIENISEEMKKNFAQNYKWLEASSDFLKLMLENHSSDKTVSTNAEWENSAKRANQIFGETYLKFVEDMKECISSKILKSIDFFEINSTKVYKTIISEIDNYSNINGIDSLQAKLDPDVLLTIKNRIEKTSKINILDEDFSDLWTKGTNIKIIKYFHDQLNDCQTLFAFFKTGNLDLIQANCDSLIAFKQIFKISDLISENLISHVVAKEVKRIEGSIRNSLDQISDDLTLKAKLLNHPKIVLAEKLKISRNIYSKLVELFDNLED